MCKQTPVVLVLGILGCLSSCATVAVAEQRDSQPQNSSDLAVALRDLASPNPKIREEAAALLIGQPCTYIGPMISEVMNSNAALEQVAARRSAFKILSTCTGDKGQYVGQVLLDGLAGDDPLIGEYCASSLATASGDMKKRAAKVLSERWEYWIKPDDDPPMWITNAVIQLDAINPIAEKLMTNDIGSRKSALWVLGVIGSKTAGEFDGIPQQQQDIRSFVIESLSSPEFDERNAALESLMFVFGDDLVVFHSESDYELNPVVVDALQRMAAEDPDEGLRSLAASGLQQLRGRLDYAAEEIRRRIQQVESTPAPETP